jgi:hypothetical protein
MTSRDQSLVALQAIVRAQELVTIGLPVTEIAIRTGLPTAYLTKMESSHVANPCVERAELFRVSLALKYDGGSGEIVQMHFHPFSCPPVTNMLRSASPRDFFFNFAQTIFT